MEATLTETSSIEREIHFILTPEEFSPFTHKLYQKAQAAANIKGFRKGKAPLSLIKKMHGKSIREEATEEAIQKTFADYATEHELQPFGTPYVVSMTHTEEGGVDFRVRYEIMPEFELGEFKGLKAKKLYHAVTEEEIEKEIEWLRDRHRTEETVDTVADENHTAVVDFQKLDESGTAIIGDVSRDVPVNLRSERINPELKAALIGKRLDDKVHIELPVGGDDGEILIPYELTIKDIKHVALPEVDAEFASKITGQEDSDVSDLHDTIKQAMEAEYEGRYSNFFRDALIDQLIDAHSFDVPAAVIGQLINSYLEEEKKNYKDGKLPEDFPYQEFYVEKQDTAERVARWLLIRDKIVEQEDVKATEEDIEGLARMDAERMGIAPESLLEYYKSQDDVEQRIVAEKVMQMLVDYAEVEEEIEDIEWQRQQEEAKKAMEIAEEAINAANATSDSTSGTSESESASDNSEEVATEAEGTEAEVEAVATEEGSEETTSEKE